jgi:hypothetical protein
MICDNDNVICDDDMMMIICDPICDNDSAQDPENMQGVPVVALGVVKTDMDPQVDQVCHNFGESAFLSEQLIMSRTWLVGEGVCICSCHEGDWVCSV